MHLDSQEVFSDGQAIAGAVVFSTNSFKFGKGDALLNPVFVAEVAENFAGGTGVEVELQTATDAAFTTPVTLFKAPVVLADLKKGNKVVIVRVPYGNLGFQRVKYTPTGTFTAGKFDTYLAPQVDLAN